MATKKKNVTEETGVLPIDFFGDVVAAEAQPIVSYIYKYGDKSVEVKCKRNLTYNEKDEFTSAVWDVYYSADDGGNYAYRPYMLDLCIRYLTVKMYCINVPMSDDNDIGVYEHFLINTDFYEQLLQHINLRDYRALCDGVREYIDTMVKLHTAVARTTTDIAVENLVHQLSNLIQTAAENQEDLNYINSILNNGGDDGGGETE